MENSIDEQNRIWNKHYSWLDEDDLLKVITNSFYYGSWQGRIIQDRLVPGTIWRDQKTHRQRPEPTIEEFEIAIERYWSDEPDKPPKPLRELKYGQAYYYEQSNRRSDALGAYIDYHPCVKRRINELTKPLLYEPREDVQQLVKEYQAGNKELLPRIESQLGGIINKAEEEFSYIGRKEVFTNLAGKFNKRLSKPNKIYSDNSPMGDSEDQRLMLIMEPFKFQEEDRRAAIDKSLIEALESYRPNQGARFKTWFYKIYSSDLLDLYRVYQNEWERGHIIKTHEEYEEKLKDRLNASIDFTEAAELVPAAIMKELTLQQKRWIALFLKMLPDRLTKQLTADVLGISESAEYSIRRQLQEVIIDYTNKKLQAYNGNKKDYNE